MTYELGNAGAEGVNPLIVSGSRRQVGIDGDCPLLATFIHALHA